MTTDDRRPTTATTNNDWFGLRGLAALRSHKWIGFQLVAALTVAVLLVGCAQRNQEQEPSEQAAQPPPAPTETTVQATSAPPTATQPPAPTATVVPEGSFVNPIFRQDFPDPHVIEVDGTYYAYATNASGKNVQMARSTDLIHWEYLSDAMPAMAPWAQLGGSYVWAPEVMQIGDQFVLYYTARDKEADVQCVGVATADSPEGKFRDTNGEAFVCQTEQGGTIDAHPFRDGDKLYLYYKNDGNCCGQPTYLYVQEMTPDGLGLVGEPVQLVRNDTAWEGHVVEAPTMWKHEDQYYLFFSANNYGGFEYAVGYATCESPMGPCEDSPDNPILASTRNNPPVIGPGHQTLVQVGDETWIVYHAWEVTSAGLKGSRRFMWADQVVWEDGKPVVQGPTTVPQPEPGEE
jgi:beta-xylosidase